MQRLRFSDRVPADIEVWQASWPASAVLPSLADLDAQEAARARRYRRAADAQRFVQGRRLLRQLLAERLGVAAARLRFDAGPHGKPLLAGAGWHFNVSHAANVALVALSPRHALGVDVEQCRGDVPDPGIEALSLTSDERARLAAAESGSRLIDFYRHWVAKEAVLKALGWGIASALQQVRVQPLRDGFVDVRVDGAIPPSACALPAPAGCLAALAWFRTEKAGMPA
ncbi:4'-phosphopantetheinyl transferase superfamily protein [Achromobacter xylosoxidans]|uniref:4'-phosphopantetheinyl transferase family protein n=1 Tax=Alcaligenes xylosoxydans xylosoxydans TaxID=85698 RepID=UPI00204075D3|nr:4'-phosphopantetheinyl transferase superfamily protein [Achromobacter xylosoxidans]MCM2572491.1 4'-phosphopantetheinyl transferase superfamily protein [Achromobacter xylosoxidans]